MQYASHHCRVGDMLIVCKLQRETRNWARQERFLPQTVSLEQAEGYERDTKAMAEYENEKIQIQIWTVGIIAFCFAVINQYYSQVRCSSSYLNVHQTCNIMLGLLGPV